MTTASEATRWVRVGTSSNQDPERAVAEALAPVLELGQPKLAILFCSPAQDLTQVSRLVSRHRRERGDRLLQRR